MSSLADNKVKSLKILAPNMPFNEHMLLSGTQFEAVWILPTVVDGGKAYLRVVTSPTKYTILNNRQLYTDQEKCFYRVYGVFTGGATIAAIPIVNSRDDSTVASDQTIHTFSAPATIDPASLGVIIPLFGVPGQGVSPSAAGRTLADSAIRIVKPNTTLLLEFENASVNDTYFQLDLKWAELSPEAMPLILDL